VLEGFAFMSEVSSKPYLVRAIHEWCTDAGYTPYLAVKVSSSTRVPQAYVKNGEIVLNISHTASRNLTISNELVQFSARFSGVSHEISVPMDAIAGIFARENGKGMFFEVTKTPVAEPEVAPPVAVEGEDSGGKPSPTKPRLTVVK
jgi:stringent starvation protein B